MRVQEIKEAGNQLIQQLRKEGKVGFVDLWDCFAAKEDMYILWYSLHLSGKGAAVFAEGLKRTVA